MCRLVAYLGHDVLLDDILVKPVNSIVMQSLHARESSYPTNGDGFGVGWYSPEIADTPALFKSIYPAWNDDNLLHLTAKIKSPCFFAHVRAASAGGVTHYNCHPFIHDKWMLMHNGDIYNFIKIKRHLRHLLDDDIYNSIQGETDSEHLFAVFLQYSKGKNLQKISTVANILEKAIKRVLRLIREYNKPEGGPSYINVCLTDGKRLVAVRLTTDPDITQAESMHYSIGSCFIRKEKYFHMQPIQDKPGSLLVTSEKLTNINADWHEVPVNNMLIVDENLKIHIRELTL